MVSPRLILGIGNILLGDEGIGVRVVEALRQVALPDDVELIDGGTSGADLVNLVADRRKVIVIDAVDSGLPPGAVTRVTLDEIMPSQDANVSLHQVGLMESLWMARQTGCEPGEVVIVAVQPASITPSLELTPAVATAMPEAVELVLAELDVPNRN
jgi:hydrogenase maturation protease